MKRHGKAILAAVLLCAAAGVYWVWGRDAGTLSDRVSYVCVATGQIVSLDRSQVGGMYPLTNPKTGERTLLPYEERDGKVYVSSRYRNYVNQLEQAKANRHVDPKTLEVLAQPRP